MADLRHALAIHAELRDRLKTVYGLDDNDPTLIDTLEGLSDLDAAIAAVVREAREAETFAGGLGGIIKAAQDRKARILAKAELLRGAASWAMQDAGLTKITMPDLTIIMARGRPQIVIDDEAGLPPDCVTVVTTTKPDRAAIKSKLDAGEDIIGARYSNAAPVLTVRSS